MHAQVTEIVCKSVLNRSQMPFAGYTLNAYQGCPFTCSYCYVPEMRGRFGLADPPWGGWISVKTNAPEVLRGEMRRADPEARIAIGTASDSWQPIDKRYGIARRILEILANYPNPVSLVTRSPLLLRDLDILQELAEVRIAISIPSFDERVRQIFEPLAPTFRSRAEVVRRLVGVGLKVQVFFCPVIPGIMDRPSALDAYFQQVAALGARSVMVGSLNYQRGLGPKMRALAQEYRARFRPPIERSLEGEYLRVEAIRLAEGYGVRIAGEPPTNTNTPPLAPRLVEPRTMRYVTGALPLG